MTREDENKIYYAPEDDSISLKRNNRRKKNTLYNKALCSRNFIFADVSCLVFLHARNLLLIIIFFYILLDNEKKAQRYY